MARILINLHSKQTIPNYIAIKEINPDKVVALATTDYSEQTNVFEEITGIAHVLTSIDAYNLEYNFNAIQNIINQWDHGDEIVINYTGGTKIMSVSLVLKVLLSAQQALSFVYVNTYSNKLEYLKLSTDKKLKSFSGNINTKVLLETYILLKGEKIKSVEDRPTSNIIDRFNLTESLLLEKDLSKIFNKQGLFFKRKGLNSGPKKSYMHRLATCEISWTPNRITALWGSNKLDFPHQDGGKYFTGAWLEEYVFVKLAKTQFYDEVLSNVKFDFTSFSIENKPFKDDIFKNEMDVVVTKGLNTVFIECKAGQVKQDHVYKLQALRDYFLGTFGKAVMVCKLSPKPHIVEKCKDVNITIVSGNEIKNINKIINKLIE